MSSRTQQEAREPDTDRAFAAAAAAAERPVMRARARARRGRGLAPAQSSTPLPHPRPLGAAVSVMVRLRMARRSRFPMLVPPPQSRSARQRNCCAAHNRCSWARTHAQSAALGPTVALERHSLTPAVARHLILSEMVGERPVCPPRRSDACKPCPLQASLGATACARRRPWHFRAER